MQELAHAKKVDGVYTITVKNHKTAKTSEAILPFAEEQTFNLLM